MERLTPELERLIKKREELEKDKLVSRSIESKRREMIIAKFKETNNKDPTEEEIKKDIDFLENCHKRIDGVITQ